MLETIAVIVGSIFILLGLAGSVLPVLPGPPLSFIGLLVLAAVTHFEPPLTSTLIIAMAILTFVVAGLDYVIPLLGAKRYGATKWGLGGSIVGMIAGLFYPPFGLIIGAFAGAVLGEWLASGQKGHALRAGWGSFIGILLGTVLKLGVSAVMAYYFVRALV